MQWIFVFVMISGLTSGAASSNSDDADTKGNLTSRGELLLELGKKYNKPLLKYLGQSLIGLEIKQASGLQAKVQENTDLVESVIEDLCGRSRCTHWSEWTNCTGNNVGDLSMVTRSRTCGIDTTVCSAPDDDTANKTETESKLCEVKRIKTCPIGYTKTKHGFCLRYYGESKSNSDAEATCKNSGAHLVNINSQTKSDDVDELLASTGHTYDVWIDGYRPSVSAPWQYRYGPTPQSQGFSNWDVNNGHPTSGRSDLCQLDDYRSNVKTWLWWAERCSYTTRFVCEY